MKRPVDPASLFLWALVVLVISRPGHAGEATATCATSRPCTVWTFTLPSIPPTDADLVITAIDADQAAEGTLTFNGNPGAIVELFGDAAVPANDVQATGDATPVVLPPVEIPREWLWEGTNTATVSWVSTNTNPLVHEVTAMTLSWGAAPIPPIGAGPPPCVIQAKPMTDPYFVRVVQACGDIAAAAILTPAMRAEIRAFAEALETGTVSRRSWPLVFSEPALPSEVQGGCGSSCHGLGGR